MAQFRVEVNESVDAQKWDALVSKANWGTVGQTTFWADRLVALWNCKPYFYTVFSTIDVPVLLLVGFDISSYLIRDQSGQFIERLKDHARRGLGRGNKFQWFGQPALLDHGSSDEAYRFLFSEVQRFCEANRIRALTPSELPKLANASVPESWAKKEWGTYIVDLRQDVDTLWNNLKKSARKAIRTARDDGITVRRMRSLEDLRAYYDFVCLGMVRRPTDFLIGRGYGACSVRPVSLRLSWLRKETNRSRG
jgi:hypothetical protein